VFTNKFKVDFKDKKDKGEHLTILYIIFYMMFVCECVWGTLGIGLRASHMLDNTLPLIYTPRKSLYM
jgi:hypothetical protein